MTRILRYILVHDTGMAPCVEDGLITLATCKPEIRSSANLGDWVVGCRPSPAPRGLVVWAGRIAEKLEVGEYERRHRGRLDAIYRAKRGGAFTRLRPTYHDDQEQFLRYTSHPVLLFDADASWYFGSDPHLLAEHLMHLAPSGRGHRVSGVEESDASAMHDWLALIGLPGILGIPRDPSPFDGSGCSPSENHMTRFC